MPPLEGDDSDKFIDIPDISLLEAVKTIHTN